MVSTRKRLNKLFSLTLVLALILSIGYSFGAENSNRIYKIEVQVNIFDDGSAEILQIWDVNTVDGTEYYITHSNIGDMQFIDFKVSDESGRVFDYVDNWDVNASRQQKAYKNGINYTNDGLELCWGIGDYGKNTFYLGYIVSNFVKAYNDYDGFISRFINDELSSSVDQAIVFISIDGVPLTEENTDGWGFGYEGYINLNENGSVVATPEGQLERNEHVTVMLKFNKGLINPVATVDGSFKDVEDRALQGSDYENEEPGGVYPDEEPYNPGAPFRPNLLLFALPLLFPIAIFVFVFLIIIKSVKKSGPTEGGLESKTKIPNERDVNYYRDVPIDGHIPATFAGYWLKKKVPLNDIMGAYILRWLALGAIELRQDETSGFLGFGNKTTSSLVLKDSKNLNYPNELVLYSFMEEASGTDRILQEKEFKKWSTKNYTRLNTWLTDEARYGRDYFVEIGAADLVEKSSFMGLMKTNIGVLNQEGDKEVEQIIGFKKYLDDFTIINERQAKEVELWDEYLIFASIFGIAEKVAEEMKALYPEYMEQSAYHNATTDVFTTMMIINSLSRASYAGMQAGQASSSSSGGGFGGSSMGGGGGFSGGGSGGGVR